MAITFDQIPGQLRVPFVGAEFNASQASQGPSLLAYRQILIGQKLTAGTAPANTLARVTSADQVIGLAGRGSMLHRMAIAAFASNRVTETWIGVLEDAGSGVAAQGTITVTTTTVTAGTIPLYLGGVRVPIGVAAGASAAAIATSIAAEITARPDLPVTATAASGVVTVVFRHKGTVGNSYDLRSSYLDGDALPGGVSLAIVQLAGGTSNPTLAALIAAMGDSWFQVWSHPYTDGASLTSIEGELASRFGPLRMIDGVAITSAAGTLSALSTLGVGRNSQHSVIVAQPGERPLTPPMEFAAEVAALVALHGSQDPARPFQTLATRHALPPLEVDLFTLEERNLLLFDGIATTRAGSGGAVQLDRLITTYQRSPSGADDVAYLDVTTPLTLLFLRFDWRRRIQTRYPRHKLASDGVRLGSGQAVVTPLLMKGEALAWFAEMEELGLVEGFAQFKAELVVERSASDQNRLDLKVSPDLINQLIVHATQIAFRV